MLWVPRGPVGGSTAALIRAAAEHDVHVSPYQIERWRTAGELPRPVRHGQGRGNGVRAEDPDQHTVMLVVTLANASRQGRPRPLGHALERLGRGLPVDEKTVRHAFTHQLDRLDRLIHADSDDADTAWQARSDAAVRAARDGLPVHLQNLVDAIDDAPARAEPPPTVLRSAMAGLLHGIGSGEEDVTEEELIDAFHVMGVFDDAERENLRRTLPATQRAGGPSWLVAARMMSIAHQRTVLAAASFDQLRRACAVLVSAMAFQPLIVMLGILDITGTNRDLHPRLRQFDERKLRQLQADPMWSQAGALGLMKGPRRRVMMIAWWALTILVVDGQLEQWEAYTARLEALFGHGDESAGPEGAGSEDASSAAP